VKITPREKKRRASRLAFLAWGDFHARSRLARFTIPEEKWGTTRSLSCRNTNLRVSNKFIVINKSSSFLFCHFQAMLSKGCAIYFAPYT